MQTISYVGNGTTTEFAFNFPYYEDSNIVVTKNGSAATGYSIVGTSGGVDADIPYIGGKVVFETAPTILETITISRYLPRTRTVDYQPLAKIDPTTLNQDMNYTMEVIKDMQDDLDIFHNQYESIVDKPETENLLEKIANVTDEMDDTNANIEDFYQAVEDKHIMSTDMFYSHTTNSITAIPQDIKLTLSDGTLTLKTGSKLYVPNGSGTFDILTLTADKTATQSANDSRMYFYNGSYIEKFPMSQCHSGATEPSGQTYMFWYDTVNNLMKMTTNGGSTWTSGWSLPFCIATASSGALTSIDQVFNGFGYIDSTVFALPGVRGLTPNGRNADGTLKNDAFETKAVQTTTVSAGHTIGLCGTAMGVTSVYSYDSVFNRNLASGVFWNACTVGSVDSNGVISFKNVFYF